MNRVIIYTSKFCPKCTVLKDKLKMVGLEYEEISDVDVMREKGFSYTPILEVDGKFLTYTEAFMWIAKQQEAVVV